MIYKSIEQHIKKAILHLQSTMAPIGLKTENFSFCADGTKIFSSYVNDGIRHCPDASDEIGVLAPPVPNFQEAHAAIIDRLEKMEEAQAQDSFGSNFWGYVLDLTERVLPIMNSLILFSVGGKKAHSRYKRRRRAAAATRPQQPELLI